MNTISTAERERYDFTSKLRQPALHGRVMEYVLWQRAVRAAKLKGETPPKMPDWAPLSINLDPTTACNYACNHCIDWDMLNSGKKYEHEKLVVSLTDMAARGLRSVIMIGGGEPTVDPHFEDLIVHLKNLNLQVGIVSNGGRNERILNIFHLLNEHDWVRLSLDSGKNETFLRMHNPRGKIKNITLDEICSWVPKMREKNRKVNIGFSFIVVWKGAEREKDVSIIPNIGEIITATKRARDYRFTYISFKPFLERQPDGAEVMNSAAMVHFRRTLALIREQTSEAKHYETDDFKVLVSSNLRALEDGTWRTMTNQPRMCHKQALQQVLSPLGLYNCPAHRGVGKALIADKNAYADEANRHFTRDATAGFLDQFNASYECRNITCLYNSMNWWLENAIEGRLSPEEVAETEEFFNYFL